MERKEVFDEKFPRIFRPENKNAFPSLRSSRCRSTSGIRQDVINRRFVIN